LALYVVTGGAGFIGSHLVDALLAAGHAVRVVDDLSTGRRENVDPRAALLIGDAADPAVVRAALDGAAGCFHLAAVASVARANADWLGSNRSNLTATIAVLDAARHHGRLPVVYASSAAVYGDQGGDRLAETALLQPESAYGADKLASELHARVAFGVHGVPTTGLRFFNVYGPRQDPASPYSGVISIFAAAIAAGRPITVSGDGQQIRDFVFVADVVRHLIGGMERLHAFPAAAVFNVCTGRAMSVLALARTLGQVAGRPPHIAFGPARPGDVRKSLGDPSLARAALGVTAEIGLVDGLASLLASLRQPALPLVA
jgi:UDP-glucose 4-epimerase